MPLDFTSLKAAVARLGTEVGETGDKVRADAARIVALEALVAGIPGAQAEAESIAASLEASATSLDTLQATLEAPNPGEPVPVP